MCACIHECVCCTCAHIHSVATGGQKRVSDASGLELQEVVSWIWVLGTEFQSPARAASVLNCAVSYPAPLPFFFMCLLLLTQDLSV